MLKIKILVAPIFFSSFFSFASSPKVAIESIHGAPSVTVTNGAASDKRSKGAAIEGGDHVKTGAESVRLIYADGSQLLIGKNTDLEVIAPDTGVQWNHLHKGQVRAVVAKPSTSKKLVKSYRFGIRTKSCVSGVRGTDFTVETNEQGDQSTVRTLDGQVDVAKDQPSLLSGKGMSLLKDHFVTGNLSQALSNPTKFDRAQYMSELKQKQPGFGDLMKKSPMKMQDLEKYKEKLKPGVSGLKAPAVPSAPEKPKIPDVKVPEVKPAEIKAPEIKKPEIKNPFGR